MFKLKKQLNSFKIVLFIGLCLLVLIANSHQVMAMDNLVNTEIQEIKELEENEETTSIISIKKLCALHEMGHAVVAFELSQRNGKYLINLAKIKLTQDDDKKTTDGFTHFVFDKENPFGYLLALSVFYGGLEAEKTITMPIEKFKNNGNHDEQDIERTAQNIIEREWFLGDFYLSTDSLEIRKDKIKNIAQTKTQEIIKQYQKFLSPLADELLKKQNIAKREFETLLTKLINQKNPSQKITQTGKIVQLQYNLKKTKYICVIL